MHIGAKKEASKRPWVAGFVYLGRFRRSACPSLRRIGAVMRLVNHPFRLDSQRLARSEGASGAPMGGSVTEVMRKESYN